MTSVSAAASTSPGAFTVTTGLAVLIYGLVDANNAGWGSAQTIGLLALAAVLLTSFVVIESRSSAPLMPFDVFSSRTRTGSYVVGLLVGASLFSMFFFISLYMQQVLGWDALKSGLLVPAAGGDDHHLGRASPPCW